MNIKDITNQEVAGIFKMIPGLFKSKVQKSKEYISDFLGLFIQRSNFYGLLDNFDNAIPLHKNNTQFNSPNNIKLLIEGIVILSKVPSNAGAGDVEYSGYGLLEVNDVVIYDGRGGSGSGSTEGVIVVEKTITEPTNLADVIPVGYELVSATFKFISGETLFDTIWFRIVGVLLPVENAIQFIYDGNGNGTIETVSNLTRPYRTVDSTGVPITFDIMENVPIATTEPVSLRVDYETEDWTDQVWEVSLTIMKS